MDQGVHMVYRKRSRGHQGRGAGIHGVVAKGKKSLTVILHTPYIKK